MFVLMASLTMLVGLSGMAMAKDDEGEVTKVKGKTVTIKVTKGKEYTAKVEIDTSDI